MKYLAEFSDPELARKLVDQIHATVTKPWAMMEVCGGQTHTIVRHGIDQLLPDGVEMIHGPGCPVCVTPLEIIDKALEIASQPGVIFCSFGDMLRVPGSGRDLFRIKSEGGDVRVVYSPLDALKIAKDNPDRAGGVLRDRVRDDRAAERDDGLPGQAAEHRELQSAGLARPGAAGDRRDHGVAELPGPGVPGGRSRLQRDGHLGVPGAVGEVQGADRGDRVRAAGHPGGDPAHGDAVGARRARGRERVPAGRAGRGQQGSAGDARRRLRDHRPCLAGDRGHPAERLAVVARAIASTTRSTGSRSATSRPRNRRSAAAAKYCRATSSRTSARPSEHSVLRATRSARRWSPARAPALPTTSTAVSMPRPKR